MRKKIVGMSVIITLLTILCAHSAAAQAMRVHTWTNKLQYDPGGKGILKISILNELDDYVIIYNITIEYPWFHYNAEQGEWTGNETIEGEPLATLTPKGGDYYYEEEFTVPSDGTATMRNRIAIDIMTSEGRLDGDTELPVAAYIVPTSIVDLNTWMTSLVVAVVVCTIILAMVILFATRRRQTPRPLIPRSTPPPPPKPQAKAE